MGAKQQYLKNADNHRQFPIQAIELPNTVVPEMEKRINPGKEGSMEVHKTDIILKIEKEHQALKQLITTIIQEMQQPVPEEAFDTWKLEFIWRLRDFRNQLLKHFELEEHGGFVEDMLRIKPENHARLKALEAQHQELIDSLDEIIAALKALGCRDCNRFPEIRSQIEHLLKQLETHEAAERDLIQSTYLQDFGAAD